MGKTEDGFAQTTSKGDQQRTPDNDQLNQEKNSDSPLTTTEGNEQKIEDVESLRKVIKLNANENEKKKESENNEGEKKEKQADTVKKQVANDTRPPEKPEEPSLNRESLEQRRAILQSIKDFDFQIKKNQDDINNVNKKLDALSKDLDDLVSLYEIVSEQMNPFVGISKVTKKRLDMMENFSKSIEDLRVRLDALEGGGFQTTHQPVNVSSADISSHISDEELDSIIDVSFRDITLENKIDLTIDKFLESLKDVNVN